MHNLCQPIVIGSLLSLPHWHLHFYWDTARQNLYSKQVIPSAPTTALQQPHCGTNVVLLGVQ